MPKVGSPVHEQLFVGLFYQRFDYMFTRIKSVTITLNQCFIVSLTEHTFAEQRLSVEIAGGSV